MRYSTWFLGMAFLLTGIATSALAETVVLEGKFGEEKERHSNKVEEMNVAREQVHRIDTVTSSNPEWDGSTINLYEHAEVYDNDKWGFYKYFGVLETKGGDKAFLEYGGKFQGLLDGDNITSWIFNGSGDLVGGTGKLNDLEGTIFYEGSVTAEGQSNYTLTLIIK